MYYKQILISSGEVPDDTNEVVLITNNKIGTGVYEKVIGWYSHKNKHWVIKGDDQYLEVNNCLVYWLKPIEGKELAVTFAERVGLNCTVHGWNYPKTHIYKGGYYNLDELYDKFLEEHGSIH